jgi:hypothetical protein
MADQQISNDNKPPVAAQEHQEEAGLAEQLFGAANRIIEFARKEIALTVAAAAAVIASAGEPQVASPSPDTAAAHVRLGDPKAGLRIPGAELLQNGLQVAARDELVKQIRHDPKGVIQMLQDMNNTSIAPGMAGLVERGQRQALIDIIERDSEQAAGIVILGLAGKGPLKESLTGVVNVMAGDLVRRAHEDPKKLIEDLAGGPQTPLSGGFKDIANREAFVEALRRDPETALKVIQLGTPGARPEGIANRALLAIAMMIRIDPDGAAEKFSKALPEGSAPAEYRSKLIELIHRDPERAARCLEGSVRPRVGK